MASFRWPPGGGSGGGGGLISFGDVGGDTIAVSANSFSVTFAAPLPSVNYRVFVSLSNLIDASEDLLFVSHVVTAKTAAGFTVLFNAPMNSANYTVDYAALGDT